MIYRFATKLAMRLLRNQSISEEDTELISYGLFSIISKIMYGIISLIFGILFDCWLESIFFYICFLFVKKYAGGFHAKTEIRCFFISTLSILLSISTIFVSKNSFSVTVTIFVLSIAFSIAIALLAPVPSKERMLDENECKRYKKIATMRAILLLIMNLLMLLLGLKNFCLSVSIAIILAGTLLIIGKLSLKEYMTQKI